MSSLPQASSPPPLEFVGQELGADLERGRLTALDALRGLAAASVVLHHCLISFPAFWNDTSRSGPSLLNLFKYSPLHILFAGDEAVILFFLLSGFVLSLPYWAGKHENYGRWLLRRCCRIWIPFAVAILVAAGALEIVGGGRVDGLSTWFNSVWVGPPSGGLILRHLILIDQFAALRLDPVVWSLVHEMRISIIFPLLLIATAMLKWKRALVASILVGGIAFVLERKLNAHQSEIQTASTITILASVQYVPVFVVGIILARHRTDLVIAVQRLGRLGSVALLACGVVLYTYPWLDINVHPHALHSGAVNRGAVVLGASIFMVLALSSPQLERILSRRVPQHLGRVSYSLYLYHAIVLLALFHVLYGSVPAPVLVCIVCVASLIVSEVAHRAIEAPAIRLGRSLGRGRAKPQLAATTDS